MEELQHVPGWCTREEEAAVLAIDPFFWTEKPVRFGKNTLRWGTFHPYTQGHVCVSTPASVERLTDRLAPLLATRPTSVALNLYRRGQGLPAHIDRPSCGDEIAIVNLLSPSTLRWADTNGDTDETLLARGDLLIMRGARRWRWTHEVPPQEHERRASLVFRYEATGKTTSY